MSCRDARQETVRQHESLARRVRVRISTMSTVGLRPPTRTDRYGQPAAIRIDLQRRRGCGIGDTEIIEQTRTRTPHARTHAFIVDGGCLARVLRIGSDPLSFRPFRSIPVRSVRFHSIPSSIPSIPSSSFHYSFFLLPSFLPSFLPSSIPSIARARVIGTAMQRRPTKAASTRPSALAAPHSMR